jgi:hypothetical protein
VLKAKAQFTLPKNNPIPIANIAIVATDLAMPPLVRLVTTLHKVLPITSVEAAKAEFVKEFIAKKA